MSVSFDYDEFDKDVLGADGIAVSCGGHTDGIGFIGWILVFDICFNYR